MTVYRVVRWAENFENNRTREMKHMAWVPMPVKQDGDGYTELLDHPNGAAHFGAWCSIVELAAKCQPRGTLLRDACGPHTAVSMSRITRISESVYSEVLPRLISIGWIETYEIPQEGAGIPQAAAMERNGTERNRTEGNGTEQPPPASLPEPERIPERENQPLELGNVWVRNHDISLRVKAIECAKEMLALEVPYLKIKQRYTVTTLTPWEEKKLILAENKPSPNSEAAQHTAASERTRDAEKLAKRKREEEERNAASPEQRAVSIKAALEAATKARISTARAGHCGPGPEVHG